VRRLPREPHPCGRCRYCSAGEMCSVVWEWRQRCQEALADDHRARMAEPGWLDEAEAWAMRRRAS